VAKEKEEEVSVQAESAQVHSGICANSRYRGGRKQSEMVEEDSRSPGHCKPLTVCQVSHTA